MFHSLARFTVRHKYWVIGFWLVLAGLMAAFAPKLADVGVANQTSFLPTDAPSLRAQKVLEHYFPEMASGGDLLLVLYDPKGLDDADRAYAKALTAWLTSPEAPPQVAAVTSVDNHPEMKPLLVSKDGQVMLLQIDLSSKPYSDASNEAVRKIRAHIHATRPVGLTADLTGQAAIGYDLMDNILKSVDKTTLATILLVVVVLLLVYRSPVAAAVPLLTIGSAYLVTRGVLGYLAQAGMKLSSMIDAFLVVLIFGVGTDYALFLISRYREEVARRPNHEREAADIETIVKIGPVITASAATVIIGTLGMMVARFEMTRTEGPAMAIGIALALLASLTLTPALLSAFGAHLFWPFHRAIRDRQTEHRSPFWERLAAAITRRPGVWAVVVTALLLLPYLALPRMVRSFDILGELPKTTEARAGFDILRAHFDEGELMPVVVVLTGGHDLQQPEGLARLHAITAALQQVNGVDRVRSVVQPTAGEQPDLEKRLLAAGQVRELAAGLQKGMAQMNAAALTSPGSDPTAMLKPVKDYLGDLSSAFPQVKNDPAYRQAQQALDDLQQQLATAEEALQVSNQLKMLAGQIGQMATAGTPSTGAGQATTGDGLTVLQDYLQELAAAYPEVQQDEGFRQAENALQVLAQAQKQAQQMQQVSGQLVFLAAQMSAFAQALSTPEALAAPPQEGQPTPADQVALLGAYLQELARAYPEVQQQPAFTDAENRLQAVQTALAQMQQAQADGKALPAQQMQQAVAALHEEVSALAQDLQTLAQAYAGRAMPLASRALMQSPLAKQQRAALTHTLTDLQAGLQALARRFEGRDARLLPKSLLPLMAQQGGDPTAQLQHSVHRLAEALNRLADALPPDAYFLPAALLEQQPEAGRLLETFLSADRTAAQVQVLLKGDPYGEEALETVRRIETVAAQAAARQELQAHVAGPTVQIYDIRQTVNQDFPRVMAVVTVGVLLVFVLLLGSLVAPLYLVATVLLSYGTTMGLVTLIFQDWLKQGGVNYAIPIVIFTLLIALGADYNIFLTSRIWEEAEKRGDVRTGVRVASAYTGGVITSAGIILAGTFAALMVSTLQSLFQIGAAVALGVLVDTFIVRSALVPAIAALVGRWNWWPAKHPIGHGGFFRWLAERLQR